MKFNPLLNAFRMLFLFVCFFKSGDEVVEVTVLKQIHIIYLTDYF